MRRSGPRSGLVSRASLQVSSAPFTFVVPASLLAGTLISKMARAVVQKALATGHICGTHGVDSEESRWRP